MGLGVHPGQQVLGKQKHMHQGLREPLWDSLPLLPNSPRHVVSQVGRLWAFLVAVKRGKSPVSVTPAGAAFPCPLLSQTLSVFLVGAVLTPHCISISSPLHRTWRTPDAQQMPASFTQGPGSQGSPSSCPCWSKHYPSLSEVLLGGVSCFYPDLCLSSLMLSLHGIFQIDHD